jgi:integrase
VTNAATQQNAPAIRRVTRGYLEQRGSGWWNRFRAECVDPNTGEIRRTQRRMYLGEFRSAAAASAELDRYLAILRADVLVPGPTITLREYLALFDRLAIALMRTESRRVFRSTNRRYLEPLLGAKPLVAIDATAVQELVAALHERGLARATVEAVRNRLLQILRHARAAGFAGHAIPRSAARLPSEQHAARERRHISPTEFEQILEASTFPRRALWAILGYSGLRIGEALGLTWGHIDLAKQTLYVRQAAVGGVLAPLKTRTARRDVPLLPQLQAILADYRAHHAGDRSALLLATRAGRPLRSDDVRRRWLKPLLRKSGLQSAGCHAFRHGLPGRLDALGLSPAAIQRFMGHSSLAMTERYLHRSTDDLREQLAAALRRHAQSQPEVR